MNLKTFFEHFGTLTEAPNGIQRLRELILDMAVRGKLVPQDPKDEPASSLISKTQETKRKLAQLGKIRCSKSLGKIPVDVIPYDLPQGWQWIWLDSISDIGTGSTPLKSTAEYYAHGTIPWVTSAATSQGLITKAETLVTELAVKDHRLRIYPPGSLIVALYGQGKTRGQVARLGIDAATNQACAVITFVEAQKTLADYIQFFFEKQYKELRSLAAGGAQPNLNVRKIKETLIPLPPLAEQKRIVAKVDELMALCDALEAAQQTRNALRQKLRASALDGLMNAPSDTDLETAWAFVRDNWGLMCDRPEDVEGLRQGILQMAVRGKLGTQDPTQSHASDLLDQIFARKQELLARGQISKPKNLPSINQDNFPFQPPKTWLWVRLGTISKCVEYGTSQKSSPVNGDVPIFRMNNISGGSLLYENFKYVSRNIKDLPRLYLDDGDLLFNRTNSYELVGKTGVFRGNAGKYTFASYLIRISLLLDCVIPEFINIAINSSYFRQTQIEPEIIQQCGQANFNGTKLQHTLIPLPPLAEQKRIVAKVDELMTLCDQLEESLRQQQQKAQALAASAISHLAA